MTTIDIFSIDNKNNPPRIRWGDHVSYNGTYVGLVVDVFPGSTFCMVASKNRYTRKTFEALYFIDKLERVEIKQC